MLGCRPAGRNTEQHDIFFGIGSSITELIPQLNAFWPEAKGRIHIDAWREVNCVDQHKIEIVPKGQESSKQTQLFFINLGGYKENEFEEYHYKILCTGDTLAEATTKAKATSFYKQYDFNGAKSHIDDKFGIDIDEVYKVTDILAANLTAQFAIEITQANGLIDDELHIGYLKL